MSGHLANLLDRAAERTPLLQRRRRSLFEPAEGMVDLFTSTARPTPAVGAEAPVAQSAPPAPAFTRAPAQMRQITAQHSVADSAVLRPGPNGPEVLVLRRTEERGGFEQIVTGRIVAGEAPVEAAMRELREETGLDAPLVDLRYVHAFGFGDDPLVVQEHAFGAVVPAGTTVRIDPAEHAASGWVPLEEALRRLPFTGLRRAVEKTAALPLLKA